jgi:3-oxoacyl-[acyl-carrier protein] reductase
MGGSMQPLTDDIPAGQAFDLTGQVAVLTGAASGIGRATALVLSGAGATVVLGDIDGPGVEATVKEIDGRGGRAVGVDITDDEFERVLDINLRGVFYGCQAALRAMIPQGSGNIINISSGIVDDPGPTMATYGMTKAAVASLTKAIAAEGAVHGIRANAIAPGIILSNFSRAHFVDESGEVDPVRFDAYIEWAGTLSPMARVGTPAEVAWMILYLVSGAASFVTGQIMRPNGGSSMPW